MKIVVIGGTGLIGSRTVELLRRNGHEAVAASPSSGVDTITGEGVANAVSGAQVVLDLANSPSFEDRAVMEFFRVAGGTLLPAERAAGVKHHIALSVVGADRLPTSGYLRGKLMQEELIRASGVPFTIVRSTQFFEFIGGIAQSAVIDGIAHVPPAAFQPIAAQDVAAAMADVALAAPVGGMVEIAGPDRLAMSEAVQRFLAATKDRTPVRVDPCARYFGAILDDNSLVPAGGARIGAVRFGDWLGRLSSPAAQPTAGKVKQ